MICEICREAVATVHLTEIVNSTKKEIHLCEDCAQDKGVAIQSQVKNLTIPEYFGQPVPLPDGSTSSDPETACPDCGMTYKQFRTGGKLGCPEDYHVFRGELDQLLEKIHGPRVQHAGKMPARFGMDLRRKREIEQLREQLQKAVESENYEKAVELRDRIYELEREEQCS